MVVALAACGARAGDEPAALPGPLVVSTDNGLAAVTIPDGSVKWTATGALAGRDGRSVFQAVTGLGGTQVNALDPVSGEVRWGRRFPGSLVVRAVSGDGRKVALVTRADPPGRADTDMVIAGVNDALTTQLHLPGNLVPEAFSTDGKALFVIQLSPPLHPDRYRVRRLDIRAGRVEDVASPDADLQQDMRGTASTQVASPDGTRLYTLYTLDDGAGGRRAFVHTLDLEGQWAHCVDLPDRFAAAPPGAIALAVSDDGDRVYVADRAGGRVAEIDTRKLSVRRTASLPADPSGPPSNAAAVMKGHDLYLTSGFQLLLVDTRSLATYASRDVGGTSVGLRLERRYNRLYVALPDRVLVLNPHRGEPITEMRPPGVAGIRSLGRFAPLLDAGGGNFQCAC
jgi:outer membrane protein assembly factor BamB